MGLLQALKLPTPPAASATSTTEKDAGKGKAAAADKAKAAADQKAGEKISAKLLEAAASWRTTHGQANERIATLKQGVKDHCAEVHPALLQEIEKGLAKLDDVLDNIDHRLADSLASAATAADEAARATALKDAKKVLAEYIGYVKGEPLIAHMDSNPFKVKTDLKVLIVSGLNVAAKAMG